MKNRTSLLKKDATQAILASVLSIIIGLVVGCVIILVVGCTSDNLSLSSAMDGIRLIFGGLFSTGRDASGAVRFCTDCLRRCTENSPSKSKPSTGAGSAPPRRRLFPCAFLSVCRTAASI